MNHVKWHQNFALKVIEWLDPLAKQNRSFLKLPAYQQQQTCLPKLQMLLHLPQPIEKEI